MSVSDSLRTTEIWQRSVGYDPYAPQEGASVDDSNQRRRGAPTEVRQLGLSALVRLTGGSTTNTPGGCRKCGEVGHLTYQCRNFITLKKPTVRKAAAVKPPVSSGDPTRTVFNVRDRGTAAKSPEETSTIPVNARRLPSPSPQNSDSEKERDFLGLKMPRWMEERQRADRIERRERPEGRATLSPRKKRRISSRCNKPSATTNRLNA